MRDRTYVPQRLGPLLFGFILLIGIGLPAGATPPKGGDQNPFADLTAEPAYIRRGFSQTYVQPRFLDDEEWVDDWIVAPPRPGSGRPIRIRDVEIPGVPRRRSFSLRQFPPMEFTIVIPFELTRESIIAIRESVTKSVPGIHLASIADNWALYLNGALIREEIYLGPNGLIEKHSGYRDVQIPIDPSRLVPGENVLGIRVIGDPTNRDTGLRQAGPYYIGLYDHIYRANTQYFDVILLGLYLFVGLYHLFMFFAQQGNRYYLFYALFSIAVSVYAFMRTNIVYWVVPDQYVITRIELISLYTLIPFLSTFIDTLEGGGVRRVTLWYSAFSAVLVIGVVVAPIPFSYDVLTIWQISALAMSVYLFAVRLLYDFFAQTNRRHQRRRKRDEKSSWWSTLFQEVKGTPKGNLLIGGIILFGSGVFDLIDAAVLHLDIVLTKYGFFLFTMGTALVLANRSIFLHRRVYDLNTSLEERIEQVQKASEELSINEAKYRSLFESVTEPVALIDNDLRFTELNPVAEKTFNSKNTETKTLIDCLYDGHGNDMFERQELFSIIASLSEGSTAEDVQIRVRTPLGEPRLMRIRLQQITPWQILLRVVSDDRDPMIEFLERGAERYKIPSLLSSAREISRRVTTPLFRYLDDGSVEFLTMCLNEIVINAVEHGNLEVTFDDKTKAQNAERYFEYLLDRQQNPQFRDRRVTVEWSITSERAVFRITDEGPGFDHRAFLRRIHDPENMVLQHGRGLMMAINAFDRVVYNKKGNQVTVEKRFPQAEKTPVTG